MNIKILPTLLSASRYAPVLLSLCAGLIATGCSPEPDYDFSTPWTVELKGRDVTYTLRAPFGTFLISRDSDIDYDNHRVMGLSSISMDWNYESGEPLWLWLSKHGKLLTDMSDVRLSVSVETISAGIDVAAISRNSYFGQHLKSTVSGMIPILQGPIWNGSASEYKSFGTTYYVIDKREPFDGSVIVCRDSATYCRLYGVSLTDTLELANIMILKDDVANWKQYQHKAQMLVEQAIIDVKPTVEEKPNPWLFWR